jgi:hypothetical protein
MHLILPRCPTESAGRPAGPHLVSHDLRAIGEADRSRQPDYRRTILIILCVADSLRIPRAGFPEERHEH